MIDHQYHIIVIKIFFRRICDNIFPPLSHRAMSPGNSSAMSAFSLEMLGDMNELVSCWGKTSAAVIECNSRAQAQGETVLKLIDENSEFGRLLKCCGAWLVRDCWADAARHANCTDAQVQIILTSPGKFIPQLSSYCESYPSGSLRCYTPHLVVGSILFSIIFFLIIIAIVVIFLLYRRRQRKREKTDRESNYSPIMNANKNANNSIIANDNQNNDNSLNNNNNNNNGNELSKMIDN